MSRVVLLSGGVAAPAGQTAEATALSMPLRYFPLGSLRSASASAAAANGGCRPPTSRELRDS